MSKLNLKLGHVRIQERGDAGGFSLSLTAQVIDTDGAILISRDLRIDTDNIEAATRELTRQARALFIRYSEQHTSAIAGHKIALARLILEGWTWSKQDDGLWLLEHPISGSFASVELAEPDSLRDIGRAILDRVLSPPANLRARINAEQERVEVAWATVEGAAEYGVWADSQRVATIGAPPVAILIADLPNELTPANVVTLRVAAIDASGVVGILSQSAELTLPNA